jgi:hypothetical protein
MSSDFAPTAFLASMSLGLMLSAFVKNGSQANSALPLLLVPICWDFVCADVISNRQEQKGKSVKS